MSEGSNASRSRAFRAQHRRFDYSPGDKALAAIEQVRALNPGATIKQVIDYLVVKAVAGNSGNGGK